MSFDEFQQLSKYQQLVEIYLNAVFVGKKEDPPFVFILHRLHNFYIRGKLPVDGDHRTLMGYQPLDIVDDLSQYAQQ